MYELVAVNHIRMVGGYLFNNNVHALIHCNVIIILLLHCTLPKTKQKSVTPAAHTSTACPLKELDDATKK